MKGGFLQRSINESNIVQVLKTSNSDNVLEDIFSFYGDCFYRSRNYCGGGGGALPFKYIKRPLVTLNELIMDKCISSSHIIVTLIKF